MSRNLVKQFSMILPEDDEKRIIDSNKRVEERLALLAGKSGSAAGGFVAGLAADVLEVPEEGEGLEGSNIIKANEDAGIILEKARSEADGILADARADARRILEEAIAQAEAEKGKVLDGAKQQGYSEGQAQAQAQADAARREYEAKARELEAQYQHQLDVLEPQFIDTITSIYEHIFQTDLGSYRDVLVHLIASTMRNQEGVHSFIVHVSKEDYPYINMQKKQLFTGVVSGSCSVDVIEDMTLGKNQCMIETENGIFDCGLGTQMEELRQKLLLLAWSKEE